MSPPLLHHLLLLILLSITSSPTIATIASNLGINYGQLATSLPPPAHSVSLIKSIRASAVKLYDTNPSILSALSNTTLAVSVMVPNSLIPSIASNYSNADDWVTTNLLPFYPTVRIRYLLVGNEVLSDHSLQNSTWQLLVPAMTNIKQSLSSHHIHKVKVGTPLAMDALSTSFPPSAGAFRSDVDQKVVASLLTFLRRTRSFFFVDVYPYFVWAADRDSVSLDYALLSPSAPNYTDPATGLVYADMLDQQLDAVAFAMARLGHADVQIAIAETGWPNAGDTGEPGACVRNAAIYNRNLARKMQRGMRTPARPAGGKRVPAFVFSLFDEDMKGGPMTERHWGVFYGNGTAVYGVDLAGRRPDTDYPPLPEAAGEEEMWCVAADGAAAEELGAAVEYACGVGTGTCDAIRPGGICFQYESDEALVASYAFNSYWQQLRLSGGTCDFNGLAVVTTKDPSRGSCKFAGSGGPGGV